MASSSPIETFLHGSKFQVPGENTLKSVNQACKFLCVCVCIWHSLYRRVRVIWFGLEEAQYFLALGDLGRKSHQRLIHQEEMTRDNQQGHTWLPGSSITEFYCQGIHTGRGGWLSSAHITLTMCSRLSNPTDILFFISYLSRNRNRKCCSVKNQ